MTANESIDYFVNAGMTLEGACGFWGNVMAESGGKSNIAQRGSTSLSDDAYTDAADCGSINFAKDAVGYGLCQWTYKTRKANLLAYAKSVGVSVGEHKMQLEFAVKELQTDYPKVWKYLTTATNVYLAASKVCIEYESPAKMNIPLRATYGNQAYAAYEPSKEETNTIEEIYWPPRVICQGMTGPDVSVAQALLQARGEDVEITGEFDAKFKNRVMVWQSFNGLAADGIIGAMTWANLLIRR
jgi:hypothetical protein